MMNRHDWKLAKTAFSELFRGENLQKGYRIAGMSVYFYGYRQQLPEWHLLLQAVVHTSDDALTPVYPVCRSARLNRRHASAEAWFVNIMQVDDDPPCLDTCDTGFYNDHFGAWNGTWKQAFEVFRDKMLSDETLAREAEAALDFQRALCRAGVTGRGRSSDLYHATRQLTPFV